jgi:hypothetical protein
MWKRAVSVLVVAGIAVGCSDNPSAISPSISENAASGSARSLTVSSTDELLAALSSINGGSNTIVLAPGEYELSNTLNVPDGTALVGSGRMIFDETSNLPAGFDPSTRTVLRAATTLVGDVVVLGDRTRLQGLTVEDAAGRTGGSVVIVHSRRAGDHVDADLENCEIINPNPPSGSLQSVGGRALVLLTRNRETVISPYAPETGASVTVNMSQSIIRSPLIAGIFVNNFSPEARTALVLTRNVIGGGMQLTGGTSRPDAVSGSSSSVDSRGNLYHADPGSSPINGLQLYGAAGLPAPGAVEAVTNNSIRFSSMNDRIEGFVNAIVARGASRPLASTAPISFNSAVVELHKTSLSSSRADLNLAGAASLAAGSWPDAGNILRFLAEGTTGSGQRSNFYGPVAGPPSTTFGDGNRVEIIGSLQAFTKTNTDLLPPPPPEFFTSGQ